MTALFITILDSTIVQVALPRMAVDFGASAVSIGWVVVGYLVSMAVWIPASGWIGDRAGTKRVLLGAMGLFTAASILCGLSGSLEQLIGFRVLQGAAAGMVSPVATAMLFRAFPPERRAKAVAILIIPTSLGPALGPLLGGILTEALSWHWIFWINGPIGIVAILFGARFLREHREELAGRFDLPGFVLSGAGLSLTLFTLTEGARRGWAEPLVLVTGVVGLSALALLVRVELGRAEPLLNVRLLAERLFGTTNLASFFAWAAYLGWLFALPIYLQDVRLLSPSESGLTTFVEALGVLVASRLVSRLYPRVGPRRLVAAGSLGIGLAQFASAGFPATADPWLVRAVVFAGGCAMAFVLLPLNTAMFARVSRADTGRASAIFNTQRRTAAAFGVAVAATILTALGPATDPGGAPVIGTALLPAFRVAFVASGLLAVVGSFVALRIHDGDAAGTMPAR